MRSMHIITIKNSEEYGMSKILMLFVLSIFITACAGISPKNLQKPSVTSSFRLTEDVTYNDTKGLFGAKVTIGFKAGLYTAEYEDDKGIYYRGEHDCLIFIYEGSDSFSGGDGGIWIPKTENFTSVRPYGYLGSNSYSKTRAKSGGLLIESIIDAEKGNVNLGDVITNRVFIEKFRKLKTNL